MGLMKKYSQFLKELPSKTVVFAFGRFNPPTIGHELLVKAVKKLAASNNADHAIYASKSQDAKKNPLSVDKKVHYLNLMFPGTRFVAANEQERTFIEAAKNLNKRYKNLIMVAGSDRVPEYEKILTKYNGKDFHFDTVQVISAGERDPDSDDASGMSASKMRALASKGDYSGFKRGLPSSMREIDGRRLMNDVRQGMGLDMVKEQVKFTVDEIREKYFKGELYNVGEIVECKGIQYEIAKRGTNHLLLKQSDGKLVSKWIQEVSLVEDIQPGYAPKEITFGGYTTTDLHHSEDAAKAFQETIARVGSQHPEQVKIALMATDNYMHLSDVHLEKGEKPDEQEIEQWKDAFALAKQALNSIGEFAHHQDYWHMHLHEMEMFFTDFKETGNSEMNEELTNKTLKTNDKVKVARMIATMLGDDKAESSSSPEQLVNNALRKIRSKTFNPESLKVLDRMLGLATEVGISYDQKLRPAKLKEASVVKVDPNKTNNIAGDIMRFIDYKKMGVTLHPHDEKDHVRKMKIKHQLGEEEDSEIRFYSGVDQEVKLEDDMENQLHNEMELSDEQIDAIIGEVPEDDFLDAYEDDELVVVDADTGEELEDEDEEDEDKKLKEEALMEVLSRAERIRARVRFARTKTKRERRAQIALKRYSDNKTVNRRARRLAVKLMKKRLLRGRDLNTLSVGEKERIERVIQKRKQVVGRVAMKLVPRIRKIEKARLSHSKVTKGSAPTIAM